MGTGRGLAAVKQIVAIFGLIVLVVLAGLGLTRLDAPARQAASAPPAPVVTAPPVPAPVPADARTEAIEALLSEMSLEEKIGQLFFVRCPGGGEAELAARYQPGGYVLFARDFENRTPDSLREMLATCQQQSRIPMLMGVDEEGGTVVRASRYEQFRESKFKSPQKLFRAGGMEAIAQDAKEKAAFLKDLGINVNLAPVCDVSTDPADFMNDRAFGKGAEETAEYVRTVVKATQDGGVGAVLKHFPGYGNNADTHTGVAVDKRPMETFQTSDFLPFSEGINAGAGCILVSHNVVEAMDGERPASLSAKVHETLREELRFEGVSLTDDLAMDAARAYIGDQFPAVVALKAGNDLVITADLSTQVPAVLNAVEAGELTQARIDEAVRRVLGWKYDLGLLS